MSASQRIMDALDGAIARDDLEAWGLFSEMLGVEFGPIHRQNLALVTLLGLEPDDRKMVIAAATQTAGRPVAPLFSPQWEAEWWASHASDAELRAYVFAAFNALPSDMRDRFVTFVLSKRKDAA